MGRYTDKDTASKARDHVCRKCGAPTGRQKYCPGCGPVKRFGTSTQPKAGSASAIAAQARKRKKGA